MKELTCEWCKKSYPKKIMWQHDLKYYCSQYCCDDHKAFINKVKKELESIYDQTKTS